MKKSKQAGTVFFCGRKTRTLLPTATSLLKPTTTHGVREKLLKKKERQTYYNNRGTLELSPLREGDAVVMLPSQQARKWKKAQVEDQVDVRSCAVCTKDGNVFRRNWRHPKKYHSPPAAHTPEVEVGSSKITDASTPPVEGVVKRLWTAAHTTNPTTQLRVPKYQYQHLWKTHLLE